MKPSRLMATIWRMRRMRASWDKERYLGCNCVCGRGYVSGIFSFRVSGVRTNRDYQSADEASELLDYGAMGPEGSMRLGVGRHVYGLAAILLGAISSQFSVLSSHDDGFPES